MKRLFLAILFGLLALQFPTQAQTDSIVRVGACATAHHPWNLVVRDSLIYLADRGSFVVIDVSNPSGPKIRGTTEDLPLAEADIVAINMFVKDSLAYIRSVQRFVIINVANPDSLIMMGYILDLPIWGGLDPRGLFVRDTIVFVANANNGLIVCNVADPTNPFVVGTFDTYHAINLTMRDSVLFIADYDSLLIINAKDPMNLKRLSALPMPERAYDVCVKGNYAYVACVSYFGDDGRLKIVDISNSGNPEVVGEVTNIRGDPVAVYLENDYAYISVADYTGPPSGIPGGVRIVNISNPDSGQLAVSYDTPGDPQDVYVVGDLVFVADYDSVQILRHIHTGVEEKKIRDKRLEIRVWPNPFKERANIVFTIASPSNGRIEIYDVSGKKVRTLYDGLLFPARYRFYWNGRDGKGKEVAQGEYFIILSVGDVLKETKKVIYLK